MARFICLRCLRYRFTQPDPHKNPWRRNERCKGVFVRYYESFDIAGYLAARIDPHVLFGKEKQR